MVALKDVVYVVDENLLRLGKGIIAIRNDMPASVSRPSTIYFRLALTTRTGFPSLVVTAGV
jgi:hypothetical protein